MIFASPPSWKWLPDREGQRKYGSVHNTVVCGVGDQLARAHETHVIIPTELISLLTDRFGVGPGDAVFLHVIKYGERWQVQFSINGEAAVPLFYWTASNKPGWVK